MTQTLRSSFSLFCFLSVLAAGGGLLRGQDSPDSFRFVVGFEKAAAVSAEPVQKLFVDLYFDRAVAGSARAQMWGDLRLGSLPRTINSTVLSLPGDIANATAGATLNELTQSGEFLLGAEYRLTKPAASGARVSLIASFGALTPLRPVAGTNAFYRQYYGGLRIGGAGNLGGQAGHVVDVSIGQNDAVTRGVWRGTVVRIDSFFALPVSGDVFYLYGTALVKVSGVGRGGAGASQDLYRVGAGIDLVQLLKVLRAK